MLLKWISKCMLVMKQAKYENHNIKVSVFNFTLTKKKLTCKIKKGKIFKLENKYQLTFVVNALSQMLHLYGRSFV